MPRSCVPCVRSLLLSSEVIVMRPLSIVICAVYAMLLLCFDVDDLQAADPAKIRVGYINNTQSAVLVEMKALAKEENLDIDLTLCMLVCSNNVSGRRLSPSTALTWAWLPRTVRPPRSRKAIATSLP